MQFSIDFIWLDFGVARNISDKVVEKAERHTMSYMGVPSVSSRFFFA
jgi:hypothetical protein